MADAKTALAAFRRAVGEETYQLIADEAEIKRLSAGDRPETDNDAEVERLLKIEK